MVTERDAPVRFDVKPQTEEDAREQGDVAQVETVAGPHSRSDFVPISVTCQSTPDYLRFEVSGERVAGKFGEEMLAVWSRVADECRATGHTRVIGISKLTGPVPKNELFRVGEIAPRMLQEAGCRRLAYVVLGGPQASKALKFGETVAVNRGQVTHVFDDEPSAIAWLLGGEPR